MYMAFFILLLLLPLFFSYVVNYYSGCSSDSSTGVKSIIIDKLELGSDISICPEKLSSPSKSNHTASTDGLYPGHMRVMLYTLSSQPSLIYMMLINQFSSCKSPLISNAPGTSSIVIGKDETDMSSSISPCQSSIVQPISAPSGTFSILTVIVCGHGAASTVTSILSVFHS
jgi:hypothetical protein